MPEHVFSTVARGRAIDAQSNVLSLFDVVEEIGAPDFPAAVPVLHVVTLWKRQNNEEGMGFVQRIRVLDPDGKEVGHVDTSFRMEKPRHRVLCSLIMIPFKRTGCHRFDISIRSDGAQDWAQVCSYPVEVNAVFSEAVPSDTLFATESS